MRIISESLQALADGALAAEYSFVHLATHVVH